MTSEAWNKANDAFRQQVLAEIGATPTQRSAIFQRDWDALPKWAKRKLKALNHYFPARELTETVPAQTENS